MNLTLLLIYLLPEFILIVGYSLLFFFGFILTAQHRVISLRRFIITNTIFVNLIALFAYYLGPKNATSFLHEMIIITPYGQLFKMITISFYTLLMIFLYFLDTQDIRWRETLYLMHITTLGFIFTMSAGNFLFLYVVMELSNIGAYALTVAGGPRTKYEAGAKYFIFTSLMSALALIGILTYYNQFGSLRVLEMSLLSSFDFSVKSLTSFHFFAFLLTAYQLFKASAVPFHFWTADVYQVTTPFITCFFAIIPKISAFYILYALLGIFSGSFDYLSNIYFFVGCLSLFIGTFSVFNQTNLKRLFAYSSIAHSGTILIMFSYGTYSSFILAILYFCVYAIMVLCFFALLQAIITPFDKSPITEIKDLARFSDPLFLLQSCFTITLLSFAGVPPFIGFFSKYFVLETFLTNGAYFTLIFFLICSTFSAVYYLKLILSIWSARPIKYFFTSAFTFVRYSRILFLLFILIYLPAILFPLFQLFI